MALTLRSGLTTEESLAMAGSLSKNPVFQEKLDKCRSLTESGEDLSSALAGIGNFLRPLRTDGNGWI